MAYPTAATHDGGGMPQHPQMQPPQAELSGYPGMPPAMELQGYGQQQGHPHTAAQRHAQSQQQVRYAVPQQSAGMPRGQLLGLSSAAGGSVMHMGSGVLSMQQDSSAQDTSVQQLAAGMQGLNF